LTARQIRAAHRARLRDPLQAGRVDPGRGAAAALASSLPALDPHQDARQRGHRAHALRILAAEIFQAAAPGRSGRHTVPGCGILSRAAHVGPGRSEAAALASSLPALDPLQDARQRGHRAHALRISTGRSCARFFRVQNGRKKRMKKQNDT